MNIYFFLNVLLNNIIHKKQISNEQDLRKKHLFRLTKLMKNKRKNLQKHTFQFLLCVAQVIAMEKRKNLGTGMTLKKIHRY